MVESTSLHGQAGKLEENTPFTIKQHQSRPNHLSYISDIKCDFYVKGDNGWGDCLCVKFDEYDKYVGTSYSSGGLKILNPFNGKVITTLLNPSMPTEDFIKPAVVINSFKFRAS